MKEVIYLVCWCLGSTSGCAFHHSVGAAEESYEALKELVENSRGSEMPDSEKKIGISKYIIKTQQRVLQLNVLSKWCQQVDGLMRLMEGEHVGPFNLGNPSEFTMLELAQVVQETIDPNAKIEFKPKTEDDPHKRKPDITKAKELLGWEPKIPLRKGLPMMVSDFRQRVFGDHKDDEGASTTSA